MHPQPGAGRHELQDRRLLVIADVGAWTRDRTRKGSRMRKVAGVVLVALVVAGAAVGQDDKTKVANATPPAVSTNRITGQCHCGQIKYEAEGPIKDSSFCDCRGCQRATGGMTSAIVAVPRKGFRILSGEPSSYRAADGVKCDWHGTWYFCPKCGSQVYWKADKGDTFDIFAGTLDDTKLFQPKGCAQTSAP